jgi:hypothetical protein
MLPRNVACKEGIFDEPSAATSRLVCEQRAQHLQGMLQTALAGDAHAADALHASVLHSHG